MQFLMLEHEIGNDGKYAEADALLYHFQLNQIEGTAVAFETEAVGGHLTAVFEKGDAPGKGYHTKQGPVAADPCLL